MEGSMSPISRTIAASWPPVLVYLILVLSIFLGDRSLSAPEHDQDRFHYQVVRQFDANWPAMDITNYGTATGPGYHYVMASVSQVIGHDLVGLRLVSMIFGACLLVGVAGWCATMVSVRAAAFLTMPLAASIYVVGSGLYVHTDNFGWMLVVFLLGPLVFTLLRPVDYLATGFLALIAVSVRQIFIWTIGPVILAGVLSSPIARLLPERLRGSDLAANVSWKPLVTAVLCSVPAVVLLLVFIGTWGGLVPPRFQTLHASTSSLCAYGYGLAVVALYAPFFLLLVPAPGALLKANRGWVVLFVVIGAVLSLVGPSSADFAKGRHGGPVWMLVEHGPVIGDRSVVLAILSAFGAGALALLVSAAVRNGRGLPALVLLCAWVASTATQLVNTQTFQRYFDTPGLLLLCWLGALVLAGRDDSEQRTAVGPPLLAVVLSLLLFATVVNT